MSETTFCITGVTDVGLVRRNNEDNFIICRDLSGDDWSVPSSPDVLHLGSLGCLMIVADGMGGMNAGEVASKIAVESIKEYFTSSYILKVIERNGQESFMKKAVIYADARIKQKVKEDSSTKGMGTTVVMAWIIDSIAHICWCGDSRAYLYNNTCGLVRLSKDHSYVQQLVDEGKLSEELAFDHPDSNIITRSLGDPATKANPDYIIKKISEGDVIMLCSDGLCGYVRDEDIYRVISECKDIETSRNKLIGAALYAGGYDNVTVTVFQLVKLAESELGTTAKIGKNGNDRLAARAENLAKKCGSFCRGVSRFTGIFFKSIKEAGEEKENTPEADDESADDTHQRQNK